MKTFTKFCLILAASLGAIGLAGIGIGMAMGARPGQFLNLARYDHSVLGWLENRMDWLDDSSDRLDQWSDDLDDDLDQWSDDLEERVDQWSDDIEDRVDRWSDDWEDEWEHGGAHHGWDQAQEAGRLQEPTGDGLDTFEDSFGSGGIRKIDMELNFAVLRIHRGEEGSDISLSGRNGRDYFRAWQDGDTLKLQDTRTFAQQKRDQALELDVWIPDQSFEEMELDLGASDVAIEELRAERMKIDLGTGIVDVEQVEADELVLDCGIGRLKVNMAGSEADYNYRLDCGIGTLMLGEKSYSGLGGGQTVDNHAEKNIDADCGIGMLTINFTQGS